jgi:hypothetical protein
MMVDADDMREASFRSWGDFAWSSFFRHWMRMCMGMHWGRCGWMAWSSRFGLVLVWFDLLLLSQVEILFPRSCFPVPVSTPNPSVSISIFHLLLISVSRWTLWLGVLRDVKRGSWWCSWVLVSVDIAAMSSPYARLL